MSARTLATDERSSAARHLVENLGLVDPTAEADSTTGNAARRLPALAGARGVLLDNTKGNAGPLLKHVGDLLEQKYGVQSFDIAHKLVYSRPADPSLLDELARDYEVVVTGVGACGSCTSGVSGMRWNWNREASPRSRFIPTCS
jgi:cysteine synthase